MFFKVMSKDGKENYINCLSIMATSRRITLFNYYEEKEENKSTLSYMIVIDGVDCGTRKIKQYNQGSKLNFKRIDGFLDVKFTIALENFIANNEKILKRNPILNKELTEQYNNCLNYLKNGAKFEIADFLSSLGEEKTIILNKDNLMTMNNPYMEENIRNAMENPKLKTELYKCLKDDDKE